MHFVDRDSKDFPLPQTVDGAAEQFAVPLMAFVQQPSLTESGVGTVGSYSDREPTSLDSVPISYTCWRNPEDKDDPVNLAELTALQCESFEMKPVKLLPDWMLKMRRLMYYPSIWEATLTTRALDVEWQTPESVLVAHANHILTNTFSEQRVVGGFPGSVDAPIREHHIEPMSVRIDGVDAPGMHIDTDPDVYVLGADLGDRILTAVVARKYLPHTTLTFMTRPLIGGQK